MALFGATWITVDICRCRSQISSRAWKSFGRRLSRYATVSCLVVGALAVGDATALSDVMSADLEQEHVRRVLLWR